MIGKILFTLAVFILPVSLRGQGFAVSLEKMNIAYVNIDNPLTIVAEGYSCAQLIATCDNGTLTKQEDCRYLFRPEGLGVCEILIKVKTKRGIKKIGSKKIRVKVETIGRVAIAGKSGGNVGTDFFRRQTGLEFIPQDIDGEIKIAIRSFSVTFLKGEAGDEIIEETSGNLFNPKSLAQFGHLKHGDIVIIENIKGTRDDGLIVPFNTITFTIE